MNIVIKTCFGDSVKITFLGTGVCIASAKRGSPGLLIEAADDLLLFDCGAGTIKTLESLGYKVSNLVYLFLTHFHIDHVIEYSAIVKDRRFSTRKELCVYGPPSLYRHSDILFKKLFPYMENELNVFEFLTLKEVQKGLVEQTDNWKVTCAPTKHASGVAYRLESEGKSILYSGDTSPCTSLIKLGKNVDVAILESSFPNKNSIVGDHLTPETAGNLARKMKCKKLVLNHFYPLCDGKESYMAELARQYFDEEVIFADDLMEVRI